MEGITRCSMQLHAKKSIQDVMLNASHLVLTKERQPLGG
jgi:hypothetical protein